MYFAVSFLLAARYKAARFFVQAAYTAVQTVRAVPAYTAAQVLSTVCTAARTVKAASSYTAARTVKAVYMAAQVLSTDKPSLNEYTRLLPDGAAPQLDYQCFLYKRASYFRRL